MRIKRCNFTLLEMVMALAVFAVVMTTVGMTLFAMQRSWKKVTMQSVAMQKMQMIDRIVDGACRNAIPFHWKNTDNKELLVFIGKNDSLLLPYLHRIGRPEEGGIRFIRFFCKNGQLIAEYRRSPILPDQEDGGKTDMEILAYEVERVSFKYADIADNRLDWYDDWNTEKMQNIPMAIQMKVYWKDGRSEVWLRRTAGSGQFQAFGIRLKPMPL